MKFFKKIFQFRLVIIIVMSTILSVLLGLGIQALTRHVSNTNTEIFQNGNITNAICKPSSNILPSDLEQISFEYGITKKSSSAQTGEYIGYIFKAKMGDIFSYKSKDNICVTVYTSDGNILIDKQPLKEGKYTVLISALSGSTTFDIEMNLSSLVSQAELSSTVKLVNQKQVKKSANSLFGHYSYSEANQGQLMIIGSYAQEPYQRFEYFDKEAGKFLMKLIYTARDEGIWIVPVSGFRDIEKQKLLFEQQIAKRGSEVAAAKVSAPAGYSEHHTGYAIDLTDGQFPKQDITNEFIKTEAYRWLTLHAKEFGFEMSFPQNNSDGVMFEPWHWRFIGNPDAINTFSNARLVN